ncbi:hypothetical protein SETIT_5G149800v2 [Setaria italica]|uniref:Uncharacterized protein n=1 Tax=Setaria italica TaxID=4555 RepID=A0A368R518_SETIT|nr:hypothetical protein SETIT_5G149800v2 [Setaria italica]
MASLSSCRPWISEQYPSNVTTWQWFSLDSSSIYGIIRSHMRRVRKFQWDVQDCSFWCLPAALSTSDRNSKSSSAPHTRSVTGDMPFPFL